MKHDHNILNGALPPFFFKTLFPPCRRKAAACLLIVLLLGFLYAPGLHYPFLTQWDDASYVTLNPHIAFTWPNVKLFFQETKHLLYTPASMVSLMADYALFGNHPAGYRVHQFLLFAAGACFLFLLLRRLGVRNGWALAAAVLWAVNPQKVESAAWISERKDVLSGFCAIASLYSFAGIMRGGGLRRMFASVLLAGLLGVWAVWAKPSALALPGVMFVLLVCRPPKTRPALLWSLTAAGLVLAAALWAVRITTLSNPPSPISDWRIPLHNLLWYPASALFPFELEPIYPHLERISPWLAVCGGGLIIGAAVLALFLHISLRRILCGALILYGSMIPVLGLHRTTFFAWCDRYNYLVSAAVLALAAMLMQALWRRNRRAGRIAAFAAVFLCAGMAWHTALYLRVWSSESALFQYVARMDKPHYKAVEMLLADGILRSDVSELERAVSLLTEYEPFYLEKFQDYVEIWDGKTGAHPNSVAFSTSAAAGRLLILSGADSAPVRGFLRRAVMLYPDSEVLCGDYVIPALLADLLAAGDLAGYDLMRGKLPENAPLDPRLDAKRKELEMRRTAP